MESSENTRAESSSSSLPPTPPDYYNKKNTEIQNSNSRITTNTSSKLNMISICLQHHFFCIPDGQSSSLIASDAYEKLYKHKLEKSQEPDNDGLPCNQLLDKNEEEPIAITFTTRDGK